MKMSGPRICLVLWLFLKLITGLECHAQTGDNGLVICDFTFPDTVCKDTPVTITNLSQGATTYFWSFCKGTPLSFPEGVPTGPLPGRLHVPKALSLVREGNSFYSFITNAGDSSILRVTFQTSLVNSPSYDVLQIPGVLTKNIFGIQVKNDNGNWYGFVTNGSSLVRLDFGSSLSNLAPAATTVASSALMNSAQGLTVDFDGVEWVGFCTNFPANTITRFSWGASLASNPAVTDLGNVGGLTRPLQPVLTNDASGWYMFIANTTTMAQLQFGNSLMNLPLGTNLGNLTWITDNRGVSFTGECGNPYAIVSNHDVVENQIFQVHFRGGLGGTKVITPLGSPGDLFEIISLSESLNIGDTIFCIALNSTPSLTIIYFPPCINSALPVSTLFDPSPVFFPDTGSYTIKLTVDMGLPTEQQVCKEIEVSAAIVELGPDVTLCDGQTQLLDAGNGLQSYTWSTGETTQIISVSTSGTYSVRVSNNSGCIAQDSIHVTFNPNTFTTVDTSICFGDLYFAGGKLQSTSGTYLDTLVAPNGCELFLTTNLIVKPPFSVDIGKDTCINVDTIINLIASVPGATAYTWQDGTHDSALLVTGPGLYWVRVVVNNCTKSDSIHIASCPVLTYFYLPTAFTPNGDGVNDFFRPVSNEVVDFHLIIYNRWGEMVFETSDSGRGWDGTYKGELCEPGVYTYSLTYSVSQPSGSRKKITGFITLVR